MLSGQGSSLLIPGEPRSIGAVNPLIDLRNLISVKEEAREAPEHHGMCTYVAPDGTRCQKKGFLHYNHIVPFSLGGKSEGSNLRLLCSSHNALCAEEVFGKDYITKKIRAVSFRNHATSPGAVKSSRKQPEKSPKVFHLKK